MKKNLLLLTGVFFAMLLIAAGEASALDCTDAGSDGVLNGIITVTNDGTSNCNADGVNDEVEIGLAVANSAGKTVYIKESPKPYKINEMISVNVDNIRVRGDGKNTILEITNNNIDIVFRTSENGHGNITYSNMSIVSDYGIKVFGWNTEFVGFNVHDFTVENIYDTSYGRMVQAGWGTNTQNGANVYANNLTIRNNTKIHGSFLQFHWMKYIYIYNNILDATDQTYATTGLDFNRNYEHVYLHDNVLRGKYSSNYLIRWHGPSSSDVHIFNNTLENAVVASYKVVTLFSDGGHDAIVENNTITGGTYCITLENIGNINNYTFRNNRIYGCKIGVDTLKDPRYGSVMTVDFTNNVMYGNSIGIEIEDAALFNFNFRNNIITNSTQQNVDVLSGTLNDFNYNIVWNAGMSNYKGTVSGIGNLNVNPLFTDAANHDFHLKSQAGRWTPTGWVIDSVTSPAIDVGDPSSSYSLEPAPNGGRINMGAYGGTTEASRSGPALPTVGKYDVYEINLTTTNTYANPYLNVWLNATFTGPTKTIKIDGFWDGGQNYKLRIAPTETGTWTYTTYSNDAQLNGNTGSFTVTESGKKGFIKVNPAYPYSFMYDDSTPFFWLADTNWDWASLSTPFDGIFQNYIDTRASQGFTLIQGTLEHTYSGSPRYIGENEGGKAFTSISSEIINPLYYQWLDKRIDYINSKNMSVAFWFIWSGDWTNLNGVKYDRYAKYLVSRYAAYDVIYGVAGEYEEIGNVAVVRAAGQYIQSIDPYNHSLTTHTTGRTTDDFGSDEWIDFHGRQTKAISITNFNANIISDRAYGKPVVNMEQCYETQTGYGCSDSTEYRRAGWTILTGGGFFTYGHDNIMLNNGDRKWANLNSMGASEMGYIKSFFDKIEYWKMSPQNSLVTSGYALANPGFEYVIYLPSGGSTTVNLSAAIGILSAEWYNPRTGTYQGQTTVNGGSSQTFTASDTNDWVLYINSTGQTTDTNPPTINSVSSTTPSTATITYSEPVEQPSSTNIANYAINNGILISSAALAADLKTVTLTTSTHSEGITYTITVNNVRDSALSPNTITANTQKIYQYTGSFVISNIVAATGKAYTQDILAVGKLQYIDRAFTFSIVPSSYNSLQYILTANDDKASAVNSFLEFDVNKNVTVYVAYDDRTTPKPAWMASYSDTLDNLASGGGTFSLFAKNFTAGHIALGGSEGGSYSMYSVVLRPIAGVTATVPSAPALSAAAGNANVTLTWTAPADGGSAITNYRIYRDGILNTTAGNILAYTNTGLVNGQSYAYQVSAVNAIGEGAKSNSVSATPIAAIAPLLLYINVKSLKDTYAIGELVGLAG